jgi:hypothetical protein
VEFQLGVVGVDGSKFGDRLSQPTNDWMIIWMTASKN